MLHVTRHTSRVTRHTSHVTRHTSHVTRHTSHVVLQHHVEALPLALTPLEAMQSSYPNKVEIQTPNPFHFNSYGPAGPSRAPCVSRPLWCHRNPEHTGNAPKLNRKPLVLLLFKTTSCVSQPIYSLSGGQKSRVAFAHMFYRTPHIIFLDEPSR